MTKKHTFPAKNQNADVVGGVYVESPFDFKKALEIDKEAQVIFDKLPPSHQKEYVTWIMEAKREETRLRRVAQTIEMLKQGKNCDSHHPQPLSQSRYGPEEYSTTIGRWESFCYES